ncbi:ABC transporter substrate-binding protein [Actinopolymorpha sp. B11F2]|uniref:ABC transporter substrate-binding protein n=1 Tax=Actinopolymorpha sp. B11F2 TaxID=3160862 RepID=UPI0032E469E6
MNRRARARWTVAGLLSLAVTVAGAACASPGSEQKPESAAKGMIPQLSLGKFSELETPQRIFNPYLPTTSTTSWTFESLFDINEISCEAKPLLGTSHEWQDPATLVVETRSGVKWSDGQPFSAKDVEFTFNMLKAAPAFDFQGLWQKLESVTADSDSQVTFSFKDAAVPTFNQIAEGVPIVPEHIWSKQDDVEKFTNPDAVGTGAFKVKSINPQQLILERNPDYWQADKIKVQQLKFTKPTGSAEVEKLQLSRGEFDWAAMFVPDIEKTYVAKDPEHNKYWFASGGNISLYMNLTKKPFDDVEFRRALTYAIDKDEIKEKPQFGYVETASQTGLTYSLHDEWMAPGIEDKGYVPFDPEEAKRILAEAGYEAGPGGKLLGKDGKPLPSFTFKVQAGWVDWIQAAQIIEKNLKAIGITMRVQNSNPDVVGEDVGSGNFDMAFGVFGGDCNLYSAYHDPFASSQTAPIGKPAPTNMIRWKDAETDELLDQLVKAEDEAAQKEIVHGLQQMMVEKVPTIPLWYGAKWFEYRTENAVGWPSEEDPYAGSGDSLEIMTHLRPPGDSGS